MIDTREQPDTLDIRMRYAALFLAVLFALWAVFYKPVKPAPAGDQPPANETAAASSSPAAPSASPVPVAAPSAAPAVSPASPVPFFEQKGYADPMVAPTDPGKRRQH